MNNNEITFGSNKRESGLNAVHYLEEVWDTELELPAEYHDYRKRLNALDALYSEQEYRDLASFVMAHPSKEWNKQLDKAMPHEAKRAFIVNGYDNARHRLKEAQNHVINSGILYDTIMEQLDIASSIEAFIDAAQTLGDTVHDMKQAVDHDAAAAAEFRTHGRRLWKLHQLTPVSRSIVAGQPCTNSVVYARIEQLPPLTRDMSRRNESHKGVMYSDEDRHRHGAVQRAVRDSGETGTFITNLAQGKYEDLTFDIATTYTEYRQRCDQLRHVGEVTRINQNKPLVTNGLTPSGLNPRAMIKKI